MLDGLADTYGDRVALVNDKNEVTYRGLAARASGYARWAISQGLEAGDVVCLMMPNCIDYAAIWLGLTRAGCVVALINTNLLADGLLHCMQSAASTHLIVAGALVHGLAPVAPALAAAARVWVHGASAVNGWPGIETIAEQLGMASVSETERARPVATDRALLIYTSGTTGLPKAVIITHRRVMEWSFWFAGMMDVQPTDRLYNCLPMYHSTGGIVALGAMLVRGASVLIRPRFSASQFWDDVVDGECTIFQYVGELCRYLVRSPPHSKERQHRLRLACGNGLQADVWTAFQQRFAVPRILEFYAATEGAVSLYNCEGRPGAIGRIPSFLAHRFPVALIRRDPASNVPLRGSDGFCIRCGRNEVGEAIARLSDGAPSLASEFSGYTDPVASEAKLLRNVFTQGDRWFRTGDLLRTDDAGYFYFVDRIGDTFRWKGENVSTTEVAGVLRACRGVTDAVVFGVPVPAYEGRAGMAAITIDSDFDMAAFRTHLLAELPPYAQPLFLRISKSLETTGTFKLTSGKLMEEGFANTSEPVWFNDRAAGTFVWCDQILLNSIANGERHL